MADKLTQQLIDALARSAADPGGLPLFAGKTDPGLFPSTAKTAAQKCVADGLIHVTGTDTKGRTPRELFALTEKGWEFLLAQVNPKQVLEDFVRVLEARQGEVGELLSTARSMADSLQGLKDAVSRVLPKVSATRIPEPCSRDAERSADSPAQRDRAGDRSAAWGENSTLRSASRLHENGVAVLEPPAVVTTDLSVAILSRLADWCGSVGEDCTLPELFRALSVLDSPPTIGEFHDCLRRLHAEGAVSLHSWTGPLYALPEPAYALLVGHGVAYYASVRA